MSSRIAAVLMVALVVILGFQSASLYLFQQRTVAVLEEIRDELARPEDLTESLRPTMVVPELETPPTMPEPEELELEPGEVGVERPPAEPLVEERLETVMEPPVAAPAPTQPATRPDRRPAPTPTPAPAPQPQPTPEAAPTPAPSTQPVDEAWERFGPIIEQVIRNLLAGNYDPVVARFDPTLAQALSPSQLASVMNEIRQEAGQFQAIVSHERLNVGLPRDQHPFQVTVATTQGRMLVFTITVDDQNQISGLYVR